jgi:hypothetical protein
VSSKWSGFDQEQGADSDDDVDGNIPGLDDAPEDDGAEDVAAEPESKLESVD